MAFFRNFAVLCVLVGVNAHEGYPRNYPERQLSYEPHQNQNQQQQGYQNPQQQQQQVYQNGWNPTEEWTGKEIPGVAGRDYPTYSEVPTTRFACESQRYPGYYADTETNCQAFHICQPGGRKDSFLCPNGTLFDQGKLVCEWWNAVDCSQAESFYGVNEVVARAMEEAARRATAERQNNNDNNNNGRYTEYGVPKYQSGQDETKFGQSNVRPGSGFHGSNDRRFPNVDSHHPVARPVYGVPDLTVPAALPTANSRYENDYGRSDGHTGATFGKQQQQQPGRGQEPSSLYLPA